MKTTLQRQQDAESDFLRQLKSDSVDRMKLSESLQYLLGTAGHVSSPPGMGNYQSFAEKHPLFFRELAMKVVDLCRGKEAPDKIYEVVKKEVAYYDVRLSELSELTAA